MGVSWPPRWAALCSRCLILFFRRFFPGGGPCAGAIVKMSGKDSGVGGTIICFSWDDCLVEPPVRRRTGQLQRAELSIGQYDFISLLLDPEGNR